MTFFGVLMYAVLAGGYVAAARMMYDEIEPRQLAWSDVDRQKQEVLHAEWERSRAIFTLLAPIWPLVVTGVLARFIWGLLVNLRAPLPVAKTTEEIEAEHEVERELGDGK